MNFGVFLVVFLLLASAERFRERQYCHRAVRGERKMAWSYMVLHPVHVALYPMTTVEYFWRHRDISWGVTTAGLVMFAMSVMVRLTAIRALGRFWSLHLEIREEHQLVTDGIYRYVRHPAYAAIMLEVISIPLVGNSYYTLGVVTCIYLPILLLRWRLEEREMIGKFGNGYVQYMKQVPAFIPWRFFAARAKDGVRSGADTRAP